MNSIGFFGKVFLGLVVVILITAFGAYFAAIPIVSKSLEAEALDRVEQSSPRALERVRRAFDLATGELDASRLASEFTVKDRTRLTVVLPNGRVVFDSQEEERLLGDHSRRPEIVTPGKALVRYSTTQRRRLAYVARPVESGDAILAFARTAEPLDEDPARLNDLRRAIQSGALVAVLFSLLLAWVFARRVTRPINEIAGLVAEIGSQQTGRRVRLNRSDELGGLGLAVNTMADNLQSQNARIDRDRKEREAIFSALAAGLLAVDRDQNVLFINQQARQLLGGVEGIVKGKPLWELTRNTSMIAVIEECLESGERTSGETRMVSLEGEGVVELTAVPLASEAGGVRGCVLELDDVSELRRLEAMRRDFVSNVSHELKTPLTAMRGFIEAVLDDDEMPPKMQHSFLQKAHKNTGRLVAIVSDLLSLSRLESTGNELEFEPVELTELAQSVIDDLSDLADSRQSEIRLDDPGESVFARADGQALAMALSNLISNAIHYSPEGGEVLVRPRLRGSEVVVEVVDQGPGIPAHERERVFERFYRLDKARSRKLGGTGLGLAIVRHVMSAHHGRVELESELGRGSCFRLVLPKA